MYTHTHTQRKAGIGWAYALSETLGTLWQPGTLERLSGTAQVGVS